MNKEHETPFTDDDFGVICLCAMRYALGRETYMPTLVQDFIKRHIEDIPRGNLKTMWDDLRYSENTPHAFGNELIDKPGWIAFMCYLAKELDRRETDDCT